MTRYATSRQKACQQCSRAKARCDRKPGRCSRCGQRGLTCTYIASLGFPSPAASTTAPLGTDTTDPFPASLVAADVSRVTIDELVSPENDVRSRNPETEPISESSRIIQNGPSNAAQGRSSRSLRLTSNMTRLSGSWEAPDFHRLELVCPINVDEIRNRWLNSYIPMPEQEPKNYQPNIILYIYRILKSYVSLAIHGRGLPSFVHPSQLIMASTCLPLSTCLSLIRTLDSPVPGSEGTVIDFLQREMSNLYQLHRTFDEISLLAAFQAFLIYTMAVFFQGSQWSVALRQAMINLQEIACATSRGGLVCSAEQERRRPEWGAWIVAEAKRRTLYTMYLLDSLLSTQDGLPTYIGIELTGLPAPAGSNLWQAQNQHEWEVAYTIHMAEWMDGSLRIDELWPIPADMDESVVAERRKRVDQWLENVDKFGTMLYAVTSSTHGG